MGDQRDVLDVRIEQELRRRAGAGHAPAGLMAAVAAEVRSTPQRTAPNRLRLSSGPGLLAAALVVVGAGAAALLVGSAPPRHDAPPQRPGIVVATGRPAQATPPPSAPAPGSLSPAAVDSGAARTFTHAELMLATLTSDTVGWVVTPDAVYRTADDGRTWADTRVPVAGTNVAVVDSVTAYAASSPAGGTVSVASTHDGGATWRTAPLDRSSGGTDVFLQFSSPSTGLVTVADGSTAPVGLRVWSTSDGGATWTGPVSGALPGGQRYVFGGGSNGLWAQTGSKFLTPFENRLWLSRDGGLTWTESELPGAVGPRAAEKFVDAVLRDGAGRLVITLLDPQAGRAASTRARTTAGRGSRCGRAGACRTSTACLTRGGSSAAGTAERCPPRTPARTGARSPPLSPAPPASPRRTTGGRRADVRGGRRSRGRRPSLRIPSASARRTSTCCSRRRTAASPGTSSPADGPLWRRAMTRFRSPSAAAAPLSTLEEKAMAIRPGPGHARIVALVMVMAAMAGCGSTMAPTPPPSTAAPSPPATPVGAVASPGAHSTLPSPMPTASSPDPSAPGSISIGSLRGTIVFARAGGKFGDDTIFSIAADGANERQVLGLNQSCCPRLAPNGGEIAVAWSDPSGQRVTTAIVRLDGTVARVLPLPKGSLSISEAAWSPDGALLALRAWSDGDPTAAGIYTRRAADGGGLHRVIATQAGVVDFSADGKEIYLFIAVAGFPTFGDQQDGSLWAVRLDGTGLRRVTPASMPVETGGRASPDGRWIAFTSGGAIWKIRPDGSGLVEVFSDQSGRIADGPTWSPDGDVILFGLDPRGSFPTAETAPQNGLYVIRGDGSGLTALLVSSDWKRETDWRLGP